ncbi:protein MAIN-LIKE 1-like [Glycine soja]|uniref:protein MAIN-LIKE 1-like n=1 Tax=Glycine soja TaxID=3848 RepID=UPI001040CD1F|nr:protein MAIN-LIKE 1-like [Glycine soja]
MVRTKGLGHALDRVIGRALGREDRHNSDDAPQRRRPTASARRQRESAPIAEDKPVVPADEPVVGTYEIVVVADVHAPGAEATANEPKGFPGGPSDPSVLTEYAEHERLELKLSSHGRKVQKLGRLVPAIEGLVVGTGLSPLIVCSIDTGNRGLIFSFVERWDRETSSFHLPVGEVTITLDDVASLLHLPIVGTFHTFQPLHVDEVVLMLVDLLLVSREVARVETAHCCTLFAKKSATYVHVVFLDTLHDLSQTRRYAWGAAALVHMYDHLNGACISSSRQLASYITLLQCWVYEHFPSVAECIADPDYDEVSLHACRWIATKKTVKIISTETYSQLHWGPIAVRH